MGIRTAARWLAVTVVACGGGGDGAVDAMTIDATVDARIDAPFFLPGSQVNGIVSELELPRNAASAQLLGLDVDGRTNDGVDNQFGVVIGQLAARIPDIEWVGEADRQIDRGVVILMTYFVISPGGGVVAMYTHDGVSASPTPCANAQDELCRRHLGGSASVVPGTTVTHAPLIAPLTAAGYAGAGGDAVLPLPFDGGTWVRLHRARVELTSPIDPEVTGKLAGAIAAADVMQIVLPALGADVRARFAATCTPQGSPPTCACASGSDGAAVQGAFDRSPTDCSITDDEIATQLDLANALDIDLDGDTVSDALSIGVRITTARAHLRATPRAPWDEPTRPLSPPP